MNKHPKFVVGFLCIVLIFLCTAGCGGKKEMNVSTSSLGAAFASADPVLKDLAEKAEAAIKSKDYPSAFSQLSELSHKGTFTADQQKAVDDALHAVAQLMPPKPPSGPGIAAPAR